MESELPLNSEETLSEGRCHRHTLAEVSKTWNPEAVTNFNEIWSLNVRLCFCFGYFKNVIFANWALIIHLIFQITICTGWMGLSCRRLCIRLAAQNSKDDWHPILYLYHRNFTIVSVLLLVFYKVKHHVKSDFAHAEFYDQI
jgi:hypothetical protein